MDNWANDTASSVRASLTDAIDFIPEIVGALIVLLVGVIVAWAVKTIIVRGLSFVKVKKYTDAAGLNKVFPEKIEFVELIGDIAKWTVIIVFLIPALEILNLKQVNDVLQSIVGYIPNVIVAVAIVMVGVVIADLAARTVRSAAATIGAKKADLLSDIARWAVVVFSFFAALIQLGIAEELLLSLWQGVVYLFVLGGAIAFGLGGKDKAGEVLDRISKSFKK